MPQKCRVFLFTRVKSCIHETLLPWIRFAYRKNRNFDQARTDLFTVLVILVMAGSRYKTNWDFEPIPYYIGGVVRKYILALGSVASPVHPKREYILCTSREQ